MTSPFRPCPVKAGEHMIGCQKKAAGIRILCICVPVTYQFFQTIVSFLFCFFMFVVSFSIYLSGFLLVLRPD